MKISNTFAKVFGITLLSVFFMAPFGAFAFEIEHAPKASVENRFIVGPAKIEETISQGTSKTIFVEVENRTGRTENYTISFEDFVSGKNSNEVVTLLGNTESETSLKNFLSVSSQSFRLGHGDRVRVPVLVSIPASEIAGGKFGSVVVTAQTAVANDNQSGAVVLGRIATLVFITVPGEVKTNGYIKSFQIAKEKKVFFGTPAMFQIAFENSGTVHLNPYGGMQVKNMFGRVVQVRAIDPWFVLPGSVRTREVEVSTAGMFGWYTATVELNHGYSDVVSQKQVTFIAISKVSILLVILVVVFAGVSVVSRRKK